MLKITFRKAYDSMHLGGCQGRLRRVRVLLKFGEILVPAQKNRDRAEEKYSR